MEARGGGILDIKLINKTAQLKGYSPTTCNL